MNRFYFDSEKSLQELDKESLKEILADPSCVPEVLQHFAAKGARDEALGERIAFHPSVPVGALALLASTGKSAVVELVLTNQERLLSHPGLLEHLMANPVLRADQRGRILELLDRVAKSVRKKGEEDAAGDEDRTKHEFADVEEVANLLQVDVGELLSSSEIIDGEEFAESEDLEIRDAFARIMTFNTATKAILAMKGGREERMILVRDSNKIVSLGVLKNPRLTESEVESIVAMRNVSDEVLRQLGGNREWTKNYKVSRMLVFNPRTPPATALNHVNRLTTRDLKLMKNSHDVPELIRRMARRLLDKRQQPQRGFKRK